jgi:hypothetical protein
MGLRSSPIGAGYCQRAPALRYAFGAAREGATLAINCRHLRQVGGGAYGTQIAGAEGRPMEVRPKVSRRITSEEDARIVAGMWLVSCQDENPGVMHHSVAERLNTDEGKTKKLLKTGGSYFDQE